MALPKMPPYSVDHFSNDQLDALRDLTCYAIGQVPYRDLFPQTENDGLLRPSDADITRFKTTATKLDYGRGDIKIRTIYVRIFEFFVQDFNRHRNLWPLFKRVYPQHGASRLPDAAAFFYEYFAVNQLHMQELTASLEGVYSLYRMGEVATRDEEEEFVKSIVGIWGRNDGAILWLEFKLAYKSGQRMGGGSRHYIRGVVVPVGNWLYFLGVDEGITRNPCLMISLPRSPTSTAEIAKISGTLLRLNTLNIISAARTVLLPIPKPDPKSSIDNWFSINEGKADIHSKDQPIYEREFRMVLDDIDNKVDGITKRTLRAT